MQELLAELLPWVLAFYLADGLLVVRRGHLVLAGAVRLRPLPGGLGWLGPWPWTEAVAGQDLPYLLGEGVPYLFDVHRRLDPPWVNGAELNALPREALAKLDRTSRALAAAGRKVLVAPTAEEAALLEAELAALGRGEAPAPRSTDIAAARALRRRVRPLRWALQLGAVLLALVLLGGGALAAWTRWAERIPAEAVVLAVADLLLLQVTLGIAYLRLGGEGWWRSIGGGLALIVPWSALHPLTHLSRALFRRFDPLTAAAALMPAPAFQALAARELTRARLSCAAAPPALAPAWEAREALLVRLLTVTGSSERDALRPPAPAEGAAGYCPLCRGLYRAGFDRCADCDVAVVSFDTVQAEVPAAGRQAARRKRRR